jgi:hypothetical protein
LRSVGKICVEYLVKALDAKLFAELYSPHFSAVYSGPSYLLSPGLPGGIEKEGVIELPKVSFYYSDNMILTLGHQAEQEGQWEVASKVVDFYQELGVKLIIALASHGTGGKKIFYACTDLTWGKELENLGLRKRAPGEFYGFTALVLGIGGRRKISGFCLFGETSTTANLEYPDPVTARRVLDKLSKLLGIHLDTSGLGRLPDIYS